MARADGELDAAARAVGGEITQKGDVLDPDAARRGPIRIRAT